MTKEFAIWWFIAHLAERVGGEYFQVVDHWDADLCAIGVAAMNDESRIVYVSTFRQPPGIYWYECEVPTDTGLPEIVERSKEATLEEVTNATVRHLRFQG